MVGIVGILLLGSLAWSAVGALFSAVGEAAHTLSSGTPAPKLALSGSGTPTPRASAASATPTSVLVTQTAHATATPQTTIPGPTPTDVPSQDAPSTDLTPTPTPATASTPTPSPGGRSPWILLPGPAPGSRVQPGPQVIEARGRGDSAITAIRLELDGAALDVSLEQRSESVWRGSSTAQVAPGHHSARAIVVDDQGRTGSFRWTFDAGP